MTKITNVGSKIIGVGKALLMPDDVIEVADSIAELPAMKAFEKKGFIKIEKVATKAAAETAPEATEATEATEETEEAPAEKKAPAKKASKTAE